MASVDDSEAAAFADDSSDPSTSSSVAVGSIDTPYNPYNTTAPQRLSCTTALPLKQQRAFFPGLERTFSAKWSISPSLVSAASQRHSSGAVHGYVIPLLSPRLSLRPSFSPYGSSWCPAWIQFQEKEFFFVSHHRF